MARSVRRAEAKVGSGVRGRPREGVKPGERVRDYPTVTVRLPGDTRAMLRALCFHMELPMWQTIRHLTVCFVRDLPGGQRRDIVRKARTLGHRPRES
jgi:hypothetical protein